MSSPRRKISRKITAPRSADTSLPESQRALSSIVDSAMDAIITVDSEQRVLLFNRAAEEMFYCQAADALGQSLDRFLPERFRKTHKAHIVSFGKTGVATRAMGATRAVSGVRSDGEEFPIEASISQIELDGQKLFTVIMRDITRRKQIESELKQQAELLDLLPVLVRDLDDRITLWTSGAQKLYGFTPDEAVGKVSHDLLSTRFPESLNALKEKLDSVGTWEGELIHRARDGSEIIVASHQTVQRNHEGSRIAILEIDTDLTEQRRIETQLLRAQRLESIGTLAAGIAHDLNNVLSPISMGLQILRLKHPDRESQAWLQTLEESAERGASMVKQVLSFARGTEGQRLELQPRHLLKDVIKILKETLPKSIDVEFNLPADLWTVRADPTQLNQVMMNLCVNARDAMPNGGLITIRAENNSIDENYARMNVEARPGDFVRITVSDNGTGMSPEVLARIFEPFFTTKDITNGTGLGLSTVQNIVKSHHGFLNVYSEKGRGTEMAIYLPALGIAQTQELRDAVTQLPTGHGELVLVVDDEEAIRQIAKGTLETYGYRVLLAADGTEAVALYAAHQHEILVVLTDMMMPFMDGVATIRALRKLAPNVKIILASGFANDAKIAEAARAGVQMFLPKPYTAERLLKGLAEVLAA